MGRPHICLIKLSHLCCEAAAKPVRWNLIKVTSKRRFRGRKMKDVKISVDVLHVQTDTQTPMNERQMFTRLALRCLVLRVNQLVDE